MKRCFGAICFLAFLASILLNSGPATAQDQFQQRIQNQQQRINQGIKSGALTRDEAATLQANLNHIRDKHARMKADGKLNPNEQQRLDAMLDENGKMIRQEKGDANVKGLPALPPIRKLF